MSAHKIGRNEPCPCGSGKKYKKCCEGKTVSAQPTTPVSTPGLGVHDMVDDWISEGYDHIEANDDTKAVDAWLPVWEATISKLRPDMRTFASVGPVFKTSQYFSNWLQDFGMALTNAALDECRYAEIGVRVIGEVLDRFVDEDAGTILNYRCDLGTLLFRAGRPEQGDAALQSVIRDCPHLAGGYVTLAGELSIRSCRSPDIPRAIALLEQALSHPVEDAADWDVEARLDGLRERLADQSD